MYAHENLNYKTYNMEHKLFTLDKNVDYHKCKNNNKKKESST